MKGKKVRPERSKMGKAAVYKEAEAETNGFKKGGKAEMKNDDMKKVGKMGMKAEGVMSKAHAGRKPRKSGGGVFSSASSGVPRGAAQHY